MVPGLMKTSSYIIFLRNEAVEVIEATETVEVIEAGEVSDARKITQYVNCMLF